MNDKIKHLVEQNVTEILDGTMVFGAQMEVTQITDDGFITLSSLPGEQWTELKYWEAEVWLLNHVDFSEMDVDHTFDVHLDDDEMELTARQIFKVSEDTTMKGIVDSGSYLYQITVHPERIALVAFNGEVTYVDQKIVLPILKATEA